MIIKARHYYKLINCYGVEFIFQAKKREEKGWIIDVVRTTSTDNKLTYGFYVTTSNNYPPRQDNIKELSDSEILAIKL